MRKHLFFFVIIFLFLNTVKLFSQNTHHHNYIVLNTGDTLYGKVEHINEKQTKFLKKIRLIDKNGKRKNYNRKFISAFKNGNFNYTSFWLNQPSKAFSFQSLVNPFYNIDLKNGKQYFLKIITKADLSHYELEWFEQGEAGLNFMSLLKKKDDLFFIRADQGLFGLKVKTLITYFTNCPNLKTALESRKLKNVSEVVHFYNRNCTSL